MGSRSAAFGLNYLPHALINLVLHGINVLLLVVLLRSLAVRGWALLAGAALFALAPFSLGPALWPSNRFDLLATGFAVARQAGVGDAGKCS